ncbi:MAG: ACT domain-containing protein [Lachnospiraceae bacterium]|nr:ACT domain-containing protein [Lachnospiraceae bacterium]
MVLKRLSYELSVCKLESIKEIDLNHDFFFFSKTDEEISLVCKTEDVPSYTVQRDDGWKGFRIQGILDFSLIGILSKISGILAENKIGIFAVSTFNTDYILVKSENIDRAMDILEKEGYEISR